VRVKVTVRFTTQPLLEAALVVSPDKVPSGRGCSVNTTNSSVGPLQSAEARPTANQLPAT
jgi:hypothetical protein